MSENAEPPKRLMTRPWRGIREHYAEMAPKSPNLAAMAELVGRIETSHLARLHAWTSMFTLCIAQTPVSYPNCWPHLTIRPLDDGRAEFRLHDTQIDSRQWNRTVPIDGAFDRLCRLADDLCWFPRVGRAIETGPTSDD